MFVVQEYFLGRWVTVKRYDQGVPIARTFATWERALIFSAGRGDNTRVVPLAEAELS